MILLSFSVATSAVLAAFYIPACARDTTFSIYGQGAVTCGTALEQDPSFSDDVTWAQGFLTAMNVERSALALPIPAKHVPGYYAEGWQNLRDFLLGYCKAHPEDSVSDASRAAYDVMLGYQRMLRLRDGGK